MVSLTLGKKWEEKMSEIANLKVAKHELKEEIEHLKANLEMCHKRTEEAESANHKTQLKHKLLLAQLESYKDENIDKHANIIDLQEETNNQTELVEQLRKSINIFQQKIDEMTNSNLNKDKFISDLKQEISRGDKIRAKLEQERDQ